MPLTLESLKRFSSPAVATVWDFIREERGEDLIEYAYLAAFVGVTGYAVLNNIVPEVAATYNAWVDPNTGPPSLWEPAPAWTSSGS
jgi:Flp pilus assembly pilin Flp